MFKVGNWIPFVIYVAAIFLGQLLFFKLLHKNHYVFGKILLSVFGGATIGILIVIFGIFNNW
jgi:hypothetical protein